MKGGLLGLILGLWVGFGGIGCKPDGRHAVDSFLDTLQARTFAFFWETAHPETGLIPDRWPTPSFSSIAAVGFGLSSYLVGVERGYITRRQAAERVYRTLRFLWQAPQGPASAGIAGYKGFFYHFLEMDSGHRFRDVELSSIDTALLMAGVLSAQVYFDRSSDTLEVAIRAYADSLFQRVEWDWMQPRAPLIAMGWYPERGYHAHDYTGYSEAMLLYVLALGSPTFPVAPQAWQAWTQTYQWGTFYGQTFVQYSPLFTHQYSHVWIDFRGIQDAYMREKGIDYFENSRRATLAQRAYAIDNPGRWQGYGPDLWGLTACDGPVDTTLVLGGRQRTFRSYAARGASLVYILDDGTLAPTAVGGSLPFAPELALSALQTMKAQYGEALWGQYGFWDAFNPTFQLTDVPLKHGRVVPGLGWFDTDYLGIDQGPILLMAENYRSELLWRLMRQSPYIVRGLKRAGFTSGWLDDMAMPEVRVVIHNRQK